MADDNIVVPGLEVHPQFDEPNAIPLDDDGINLAQADFEAPPNPELLIPDDDELLDFPILQDPPLPEVPGIANFPAQLRLPPNEFKNQKRVELFGMMPILTQVKERPGSGRINFVRGSMTAERIFDVPWVFPGRKYTYLNFVQRLLGMVVKDPNGGDPVQCCPDVFAIELPQLICQEVSVEGELQAGYEGRNSDQVLAWPARNAAVYAQVRPYMCGDRMMYQRAIITAKYAPKEFSESLDLSGQSLSLAGRGFGWVGSQDDLSLPALDARRLTEPVGMTIPQGEYVYEIRQVLSPDFMTIVDMIGKINANATNAEFTNQANGAVRVVPVQYDGNGNPSQPEAADGEVQTEESKALDPFLGFPARTLLFIGCQAKRSYLANGVRVWDMTLKFQYNKNEWVKIFRPETSQYEIFKTIDTNRFIYDCWDFSLLQRYRFFDWAGR